MEDRKIINELDSIVAFAEELKSKASELRKKFAAPPAKRKKVLSDEEITRLVTATRKSMNKKTAA